MFSSFVFLVFVFKPSEVSDLNSFMFKKKEQSRLGERVCICGGGVFSPLPPTQ